MTTLNETMTGFEHAQGGRHTVEDGVFIVLRFDGKGFSKYTAQLDAPEDIQFGKDMDTIAEHLLKEFSAVGAFVVSDEVSIIVRPSAITGDYIFGGNITKMATIGASILTAHFNALRPGQIAFFDGRGFVMPDAETVRKYIVWRRALAFKNAVSMAIKAFVKNHNRVANKLNSDERVELLKSLGHAIEDECSPGFLFGRILFKTEVLSNVEYVDKRTGEACSTTAMRSVVETHPAPHPGNEEEFQVGSYFTKKKDM